MLAEELRSESLCDFGGPVPFLFATFTSLLTVYSLAGSQSGRDEKKPTDRPWFPCLAKEKLKSNKSRGSRLGAIFPPRGLGAIPGGILGGHSSGRKGLPVPNR